MSVKLNESIFERQQKFTLKINVLTISSDQMGFIYKGSMKNWAGKEDREIIIGLDL